MRKLSILIVLMSSLFSVNGRAQSKVNESDLMELKNLMTGSFSSENQSKIDSSFKDIRLHMEPIWLDRKDGFWLYVEQAEITAIDKPYRQRIYHLHLLNDSTIENDIYTMRDPLQFTGAFANTDLLEGLTPDSLGSKGGCAVKLHKTGPSSYHGGTSKKGCPSNLRGAVYSTSQVTIEDGTILSWDRGYNAANKQVWGAVKSSYVFEKLAGEDVK